MFHLPEWKLHGSFRLYRKAEVIEMRPLDKVVSTPTVVLVPPACVLAVKSPAYMLGGGNTCRDAMVIWENGL